MAVKRTLVTALLAQRVAFRDVEAELAESMVGAK